MKIIVDEMPTNKDACPFAEWNPYPPIVEETGYHKCKLDDKNCGLWSDKGCRWLTETED
jgi:hypothetical protein